MIILKADKIAHNMCRYIYTHVHTHIIHILIILTMSIHYITWLNMVKPAGSAEICDGEYLEKYLENIYAHIHVHIHTIV